LGVSSSEGKAVCLHASLFLRGASSLNFNQAAFEFLFKKRLTAEMTWGETASVNIKDNGQRDNKAAVSPSRPLNC